MDNKVVVELKNIRKEFPGVIALDQVNMQIRSGRIHALVGENGAGKSTLMKILSGTYSSYEGTVCIDGQEVHMRNQKDAFANGISIVAQELNYVGELTIRENMFLGREPIKALGFIDDAARRRDCKKYLEMMGLDYDPDERMKFLSVAQKQMVEIVKSLSRNARVIILDEPTSALTNAEAEILFRKIKELKENGIAFIFISHRLDEVFEACDDYTVLRDGKWVASGEIADTSQSEMIAMMVGRSIDDIYPHIPQATTEIMVNVERLSSDDVFRDVSFTINMGEILGFAGMMGAGRSEIARAIFGMDPHDSGTITLDGKQISNRTTQEAIRNGIAMITEDRAVYGFVGVRSIKSNVTLPNADIYSEHGWLKGRKVQESVQRIFDRLQIKAPGIDTNVGNLSGGNQQKVVLAKWLVRNVKFLILDEPTRGIDIGAKQEIYNLIIELAQQGMAILLISSDMPEVLSMSHRVAVVANGRIAGILSHDEATQHKVMQMIVEG